MKPFSSTLLAAGAAFVLSTAALAADEPAKPEKVVAFRTATALDGALRYITPVKGGLNASSKTITQQQVFTLVDLNGGELADGDAIQIKYLSGEGQTIYWHESATVIERVRRLDDACTFKVKFREKAAPDAPTTVTLQTASGKFVTTTDRGSLLTPTEAQDKALVLEIVENPTIQTTP